MQESDFIGWIRSQSGFDPSAVPVGPGDDCAVVMCGSERLLVTTDQLLDGVHFSLADCGPRKAGRKAMARNLSDIAAMAAVPLAAVATVALPKGFSQEDAEALYRGLRDAGDEFNCPLVGGDVGAWSQSLAITATVLGRPDGIEPVLRSGARPGDAICVTGCFGGAWRSSKHLDFTPRVSEARTLASGYGLTAMIDVSDGLAVDLWRLCKASGVGAEVSAEAVPVNPRLKGASGLQAALGDGEDYELLFTLPAERAGKLLRDQPLDVKVSRLGTITAETAMTFIRPDGRREELRPSGWQHKT